MDRQDLRVGILSISFGLSPPRRHTLHLQNGRNSTGMSFVVWALPLIAFMCRGSEQIMIVMRCLSFFYVVV